jgi:protease IV
VENNQDYQPNNEGQTLGWEKEIIERLAFAAVKEQKTARRWGIFFKLLTFSYLFAILGVAVYPQFKGEMSSSGKQHVAIVDVQGVIAQGEPANAGSVIEGLHDAVKDKNTKGIILNINSPGGSPVQSAYVFEEIRRIKKLHPDLPIYSVVGDLCASGGYYIASASDKIYVNQASIIGSIGVIMNGFGFKNVIDKLGVERRLLTAGEHKALLDPFLPINEAENKHMQAMLDQVHQQFIAAVREGRGNRLKEAETPDLFSGLVWTGAEGIKVGLADDFGSVDSVARDVLGTDEKVNFTPQEHLMDRLAGKFGASFAHAFTALLNGLNIQ